MLHNLHFFYYFSQKNFCRAESNPVGKGRGDPNVSPFCPPPEGRIQLSLNPFKMLVKFNISS